MIDSARFGNDQADPALDALSIVLREARQRTSVFAPLALHARHHEPVGQLDCLELERREEGADVERRRRVRSDERHVKNAEDYNRFLHRFTGNAISNDASYDLVCRRSCKTA